MSKKLLVAIMALVWSAQVGASTIWINSVKIEEVLMQSHDGYQAVTVRYSGADNVTLACAPTVQHKVVSVWTSGDISAFIQGWVSLLLAAQAQGLTVDIAVDSANCNTAGIWDAYGSPEGLGYRFSAVRVKAD